VRRSIRENFQFAKRKRVFNVFNGGEDKKILFIKKGLNPY